MGHSWFPNDDYDDLIEEDEFEVEFDCGTMVKKSLSTRTHTCKCGCVLQRDYAAAINILRKGKEKIATSGQGGSKVSKQKPRNARGVETSVQSGAILIE